MNKAILILFLFLPYLSFNQIDTTNYCIVFYNVENIFDPKDDSLKNDDAFTPTGMNHWTFSKFTKKINNISKVFLAINGWEPPDVIGVAEIENAFVLERICYHTALRKYNYSFVHYDSPDNRGVDVGLLYRKDKVKIDTSCPIPIIFPFEPQSKNRDILYTKVITRTDDTLHIFINHWTSRYSGYAATIPKRNHYAQVIKEFTDSLFAKTPNANIIITGDFNDYPSDESISEILEAAPYKEDNHLHKLNNLMYRFSLMNNVGSHKNADFWGCLDQMIVSSSLLEDNNSIIITEKRAEIFQGDFLLIPDEKYGGVKNFRTYLGPRYIGGFADHLPILIRLKSQSKK